MPSPLPAGDLDTLSDDSPRPAARTKPLAPKPAPKAGKAAAPAALPSPATGGRLGGGGRLAKMQVNPPAGRSYVNK